jgi:methionyl-tRNA formyltransferase
MNKRLKIILMSSTDTGCRYAEIINSTEYADLVMVVTGPDRSVGRGRRMRRAKVAQFCDIKSLEVFQTKNINSPDSIEKLKEAKADLAVVVDFGQILSSEVLKIFLGRCLNIHYSLLPDLRGPDPVRCALLKGYRQTGVTLMKMNEKVDAGEMIEKEVVSVEDRDDYPGLKSKLTDKGVGLLEKFLKNLYYGEKIKYIPQESVKGVSYAPKISKEFCRIDWKLSATEVVNRIRALSPSPGCYMVFPDRGIKIKVVTARAEDVHAGEPGEVIRVDKDSLTVSCGSKGVKILKLQPEGKRIMETREFLAGNPVKEGDRVL